MVCCPIWIELSVLTPVCWSTILHLRRRMSKTISWETSKRSIVKLSMHEHTYSSEWLVTDIRMFVSNNSNAMWESLIESTDLKRHRDLIHLFYRSVFVITLKGVDHSVFVIFFELIIFLLEIVEVVEEWEHWRETLVAFMFLSRCNLALFKLLHFLIVIN
jgi:hypothetical protein